MFRKKLYTNKFFRNRTNSLKAARYIVPLVLELTHAKSVVDVGCGTGEFLSIFKENGVSDILGIDGNWTKNKKICIPENCFLPADLEEPIKLDRKFDLVVSLEVAEHLHERYAGIFVDTLVNLGPIILFSAAIPFQGGTHHVNEQWPAYWAKLLEDKGYIPVDCIRDKIWDNNEVPYWYSQNILLFIKDDYLKKNEILQKEANQTNKSFLSVVHPLTYYPKAKRDHTLRKLVPYPIKSIVIKLKDLLKS